MGQKIKAPVYSALLFHTNGPILIDAGFNPDGLTDPENGWGLKTKLIKPVVTAEDDIRNRLKQLNLEIADIKMVIITHLHWDHSGGLRFFTHCPILVQKEEYRFAFNPDNFVAEPYMRNHFDFPLNYHLLEGDTTILSCILLLRTPGHTPGHQSVLVRMKSGSHYLFGGDAISLKENLTHKIPPGNAWNAQLAMDSIYRIKSISNLLKAEVIPSHDIEMWEVIRKYPEYLA
jgi:N-acyl homoserine lactone hydrolase